MASATKVHLMSVIKGHNSMLFQTKNIKFAQTLTGSHTLNHNYNT